MIAIDTQNADQALDWVRRIHDPTFADWEEHAAWLEADPRNSEAFAQASLMIEAATADLAPPVLRVEAPVPVNDNLIGPAPTRRWRRRAGGLGIAAVAGLAALVVVPAIMQDHAQPYLVQTGTGERRSISLDGTTILLNGDSRLRLDRADARVATLEKGEAFFGVRHDATRPFTVKTDGATFEDVGTAFDVVERPGSTEVAVREGAVLYDPGGAAVRLSGGQTIRIADHSATVRPIDIAAVGGWQTGRLVYRDAPLTDVADDVVRSAGVPVTVDLALSQRRFSGVVKIDADRPRMFRRMAAVMGIDIRQAHRGWQMVLPDR